MPESILLRGKTETRKFNNHVVEVVVPRKSISYEEGIINMQKIVERIKKRKS